MAEFCSQLNSENSLNNRTQTPRRERAENNNIKTLLTLTLDLIKF